MTTPSEMETDGLAGFAHHSDVNWTAILELGREGGETKHGTKKKKKKHKNRTSLEEEERSDQEKYDIWSPQSKYFCGPPSMFIFLTKYVLKKL